MPILTVTKDDMNNGPGVRVVVWFSGCSHGCPGCHNKHTWDPNQKGENQDEMCISVYDQLKSEHISGITYSGGDPFHSSNISKLKDLTRFVPFFFEDKTQWVYTGYKWEELLKMSKEDVRVKKILNNIDVLVDGMFEIENYSPDLEWVGSSNQRIIDVKKSLSTCKIVLYEK